MPATPAPWSAAQPKWCSPADGSNGAMSAPGMSGNSYINHVGSLAACQAACDAMTPFNSQRTTNNRCDGVSYNPTDNRCYFRFLTNLSSCTEHAHIVSSVRTFPIAPPPPPGWSRHLILGRTCTWNQGASVRNDECCLEYNYTIESSIEACQDQCDLAPPCDGISFGISGYGRASEEGKCYLRYHINEDSCKQSQKCGSHQFISAVRSALSPPPTLLLSSYPPIRMG